MKSIRDVLAASFLAFACCASLSFGCDGGGIEGTESFDIDIVMTPTAAAPAGSSIEASLESEDDEGDTSATLKLEPQGLPAGTYSVSVTLKSDGSTVLLGSFTVTAGETEDGETDDGETDAGENEIEFGGEEGLPLPPNFNPLDIATISVADANNVVLFTADLTNLATVTSLNLSASVRVTPGPGNPNAGGNAVITASVLNGKAMGTLQFNGHGLPPSTSVMVGVNTGKARKSKTDKTGNVSISLAPKGKAGTVAKGVTLLHVSSVNLKDKSGNVLLSASF